MSPEFPNPLRRVNPTRILLFGGLGGFGRRVADPGCRNTGDTGTGAGNDFPTSRINPSLALNLPHFRPSCWQIVPSGEEKESLRKRLFFLSPIRLINQNSQLAKFSTSHPSLAAFRLFPVFPPLLDFPIPNEERVCEPGEKKMLPGTSGALSQDADDCGRSCSLD